MKFLFLFGSLVGLMQVAGNENERNTTGQTVAIRTLQQAASFPVGFSVDPKLIRTNAAYRQLLTDEVSSLTPANVMKPSRISPQKGVYNFADADYLIEFSRSQQKPRSARPSAARPNAARRLHGHTLVWYTNTSPDWLKQIRDSTELETTLQTYIQTVGTYFRGKVSSWDVVNEAFDNKEGLIRKDSLDTVGKTLFNVGKILGSDYVARMFQYAHQADPDAKLFYNDYGQETRPNKLAAIVAMAADFKRRGIPIDGLGLQLHISIDTPDAGIENAIRKLAETGLLIHISELDIALNPGKKKEFTATPELLEKQYQKYKFVVSTYKNLVPAPQQYGITMWNVGDADSWIPGFCQCTDFALLFGANYAKKRAYQGFIDGLK